MSRPGSLGKPVEMGAVWSDPVPAGRRRTVLPVSWAGFCLHAGHFMVDPDR